jgi:Tol biopolymer transport system component
MDATCTPECGANKRLLIPDYNPDEVSSGWANEYDPAWSPDSNWIAFSSFRDPESPEFFQQDYEIFIVRVDGTELIQLTDNEFIDDYTPAWKE